MNAAGEGQDHKCQGFFCDGGLCKKPNLSVKGVEQRAQAQDKGVSQLSRARQQFASSIVLVGTSPGVGRMVA